MRAGKLRHKLILQSRTDVSDGRGGRTTTWSDVEPVWASVEPLDGKEVFFAGATRQNITHRIRCRHRGSILARARFLFGARVLEIVDVRNKIELGAEIEAICEEVK